MSRRALSTERVPECWLAQVEKSGRAVIEDHILGQDAVADELILMAMRTAEGLDLNRYSSFGGAIDRRRLSALLEQKLVEFTHNGARLRLTRAGWPLANDVIANLASGSLENF